MQPDQDVIKQWSGSAPFWEKHRAVMGQMFAPITHALIEDAQIGSGQVVLDVATGPGEPALDIVARVGPDGRVLGIDPVPEMVAAARRAAQQLGISNAQFEVASADQLPHPDNSFDAVVCRFGVMFFPSPVDAVREMLRVLKPGRKLALAVWHLAERNPFHTTVSAVLSRFVSSPPLPPDAPGAFRFATPGKLAKVLSQAGATGVSERLLQFTLHASLQVEDFWTLRREMSDSLRAKMAKLPPEQFAEVNRLALAAFRQYSTGDGISFPGQVLILSATKSRTTASNPGSQVPA